LAQQAYYIPDSTSKANQLETLIKYFRSTETELSKTGVTRLLLWQECLQQHPDDYSYSQYCFHLKEYNRKSNVSMHLEYTTGDMIMMDFAGKKMQYIDQITGEPVHCHVFVTILPYSGLIFCKPVHTQRTNDFVGCINDMHLFFKGTAATILCDNLKTAVTRPDKYEPGFTDICYQLSDHYATTFSATRPYSPRDKAMVEQAVRIVYAHVYAPLRKREFYSLRTLESEEVDDFCLLCSFLGLLKDAFKSSELKSVQI
jgi:transposase